MNSNNKIAFGGIASTVCIVIGVVIYLLYSGSAVATPQYGAATGQPCSACHLRPDGGPDLTAFGKKFQANGDKLRIPPKVDALK